MLISLWLYLLYLSIIICIIKNYFFYQCYQSFFERFINVKNSLCKKSFYTLHWILNHNYIKNIRISYWVFIIIHNLFFIIINKIINVLDHPVLNLNWCINHLYFTTTYFWIILRNLKINYFILYNYNIYIIYALHFVPTKRKKKKRTKSIK